MKRACEYSRRYQKKTKLDWAGKKLKTTLYKRLIAFVRSEKCHLLCQKQIHLWMLKHLGNMDVGLRWLQGLMGDNVKIVLPINLKLSSGIV